MSTLTTGARLVGRDRELDLLSQACTTRGGGPAVVLLGGEAGVGKTRLVQELVTRLRAEHPTTVVAQGSCLDLAESVLPLAPLAGLLRDLARALGPEETDRRFGSELTRFLPGQAGRPPDDTWGQALLFEEVTRLVASLADERPVTLVVEDLHWADRSTLNLVTYLTRFLDGCPVSVVATYRSDEMRRSHPLRPVLAELGRLPYVGRLDLSPIDDVHAAELVSELGGTALDRELVEQLVQRAEGNPFFVEELVAVSDTGTVPPTLRDIFAVRVDRLPPEAREVLRVAALVGRHVDDRLLDRVSPMPAHDRAAGLRAAVEHQALVMDAHGYRFRHALLQEAVYADLLPSERLRLHRAVADALAGDPSLAAAGKEGVDGELAHHLLGAEAPEQALPVLLRAARRARDLYAYSEAQRQLELAVDLRSRLDDRADLSDLVDLLSEAAAVALLTGDGRAAVRLVRRAIGLVDTTAEPSRAAALHAQLSRGLWARGESDEAVVASEAAIALVEGGDPLVRAQVLDGHSRLMLLLGRHPAAVTAGREAVDLARELGVRDLLARALNSTGTSLGAAGSTEDWESCLREAIDLCDADDDVMELVRAYNNLTSNYLVVVGDAELAERAGAEGLARIRGRGIANRGTDWFRISHAEALFACGRWSEAEAVLASVRTTPVDGPLHVHRNSLSAQLRTGQGRAEEARAHIREVEGLSSVRSPQIEAPVRVCQATWLLREGRYAEARHVVSQVPGRPHDPDMFAMYVCLAAVEAEAALAGDDEAPSRIDDLEARIVDLIAHPDTAGVRGRLAATHALVKAQGSRAVRAPAPDLWRAALAAGERRTDVLTRGWAQLRLAEALATAGDRDAARQELGRVHDLAALLGAAPLLEAAQGLATRARLTVVEAAPGTPPTPAGLTAREREVLALLADGRTNREIGQALFISPKTASVHVSNLLMKLGAANRTEAASRARALGLLADQGAQSR
jgi:DNA-binding CsgD family transcriptional regulator